LHVGRDALRLDATGAGVMIEQKLLPVSHGCLVRLPASFMIGTAQIHLSDSAQNPRRRSMPWRSLGVAGVVLGVGLAVVAARGLPPGASAASLAMAVVSSDDGATGDSTPRSSAGSSTVRSGSPTVEEAVRALNARLEAARIQTLQISAEDGRLSATGTLAGRAAADWAAIQQWFDQTYGSRFVLTTRLVPSSEPRAMPALQLQAIWYGARPYIVTADGEHYFNGAVLSNGWVIRDIGQDRVLLAKDGETVALNYR
ncbi:SctD/MshK family protein, partial [Bradyrhizobium sp.]|uniref:SctD/MshK family protein n=1 Tax=Bradyrhizobium sp. TaxID=376 RepID=UPI003C4D6704